MAGKKSYTITRSNNSTEKEALDYLLRTDDHFVLPDKESRTSLMQMFSIEKRFSRAFDLVYINGAKQTNAVCVEDKDNIVFVELKTTKKKLPNNPFGFFFGATKNEFDLAELLGDKYKFCFVSLHEESLSHALLSLQELEGMIKTKRIQYQINLKS